MAGENPFARSGLHTGWRLHAKQELRLDQLEAGITGNRAARVGGRLVRPARKAMPSFGQGRDRIARNLGLADNRPLHLRQKEPRIARSSSRILRDNQAKKA